MLNDRADTKTDDNMLDVSTDKIPPGQKSGRVHKSLTSLQRELVVVTATDNLLAVFAQ